MLVELVHEFVRDRPDGYETMLGNCGAGLGGGQKQRLTSVARAKFRNPNVLILSMFFFLGLLSKTNPFIK
jgi:ABC-type bacteriocin/lantibiotic exporter with double-glycine peptidase domain